MSNLARSYGGTALEIIPEVNKVVQNYFIIKARDGGSNDSGDSHGTGGYDVGGTAGAHVGSAQLYNGVVYGPGSNGTTYQGGKGGNGRDCGGGGGGGGYKGGGGGGSRNTYAGGGGGGSSLFYYGTLNGLTYSTNQRLANTTTNCSVQIIVYRLNGSTYSEIDNQTATPTGSLQTMTLTLNTAPSTQDVITHTDDKAVTSTLDGSDAEADSLTYSVVGTPTTVNGTWGSIFDTNKITYTPSSPYTLGVDTLTYKVNDGVNNSNNSKLYVYSGLTNIQESGSDLTVLYRRKHYNHTGTITLTSNLSNYKIDGTDMVSYFERENGTGTSTSNLKVIIGQTTYALDKIFKRI